MYFPSVKYFHTDHYSQGLPSLESQPATNYPGLLSLQWLAQTFSAKLGLCVEFSLTNLPILLSHSKGLFQKSIVGCHSCLFSAYCFCPFNSKDCQTQPRGVWLNHNNVEKNSGSIVTAMHSPCLNENFFWHNSNSFFVILNCVINYCNK